jgi:hypothetical protein
LIRSIEAEKESNRRKRLSDFSIAALQNRKNLNQKFASGGKDANIH